MASRVARKRNIKIISLDNQWGSPSGFPEQKRQPFKLGTDWDANIPEYSEWLYVTTRYIASSSHGPNQYLLLLSHTVFLRTNDWKMLLLFLTDIDDYVTEEVAVRLYGTFSTDISMLSCFNLVTKCQRKNSKF